MVILNYFWSLAILFVPAICISIGKITDSSDELIFAHIVSRKKNPLQLIITVASYVDKKHPPVIPSRSSQYFGNLPE